MCGNWGLLCLADLASQARRSREPLPERLEQLLRQVLLVVEMRGAQAGGLTLSLGCNAPTTRVRVLKPKRGSLGKNIFRSLHRQLWRRSVLGGLRWCGSGPRSETVVVQGHSRFGTSSNPAVVETHPHQWSPSSKVKVWRWDDERGWIACVKASELTITHNGDFDAWRPYQDTVVDVGAMGYWLDRALGCRNQATGDSPKLAGVLELLACQGVWLYAVRHAYHLHVACHVEQASGWMPLEADAPYSVPSLQELAVWADVFDQEFEDHLQAERPDDSQRNLREPLSMSGGLLELFLRGTRHALTKGKSGQLLRKWVPSAKLDHFVTSVAEAFRDNDLMVASSTFLRRATGTFGFTVVSSLCPGTVVVAARGQPMSVGFGGPDMSSPALATWSSEPSALQALTRNGDVYARYDLDDRWGEVLELSATRYHQDSGDPEQGASGDRFRACLEARGDRCPANGAEVLNLRGMQFGAQEHAEEAWVPLLLTADSFRSHLTWLVSDQPSSQAPKTSSDSKAPVRLEATDLVSADIAQIPVVVNDIDLAWSDQESLNSKSATHFSELLLSNLGQLERVRQCGRKIDLLVFGVENSLWLAQQFVADLSKIFPALHAVAMSSNALLGLLQSGPGHLTPYNWVHDDAATCVGPHTVGLALSHSGTTYPTVWATRLLCSRSERVFGMSASFDCLLASSAGQAPGQPFTRRLFATLGGIRPAEAATATTVAMQHTLSHLLLRCASEATRIMLPSLKNHSRADIVEGCCTQDYMPVPGAEQDRDTGLCAASPEAVLSMHQLLLSLYWGASTACGSDSEGHRMSAHLQQHRDELRRMGRRWSHHITEGYWGTFLPALYVMLTVTSGVVPASWLYQAYFDFVEVEPHGGWPWVARLTDALIFVFMPIIVMMLHRAMTGRRLWARFTTSTLVIVESTVNYKLLRAYVSKLLALSWRFACLNVFGQNGTDQFVHQFTHKAQSDCLLAVGMPDGRLPSAAVAQHAIVLSVQQAKFIKGEGKGLDCYSLGHNPWRRAGLFVQAKVMQTFRPRFASESLFDGLGSGAGVAPQLVVQRWHELLTRQLDPIGMPKISISFTELRRLAGGADSLDLSTAAQLLQDLIEQQVGDDERVPWGLGSFLATQCSQPAFKTEVHMHSPQKGYLSAADYNTGQSLQGVPKMQAYVNSVLADPCATQASQGVPQLHEHLNAVLSSPRRWDSPRDESISTQAAVRDKSTTVTHASTRRPAMDRWATSTAQERGRLDLHELMALLHGDELQSWIRSVRFRWNKIQRVRGVLSFLASRPRQNTNASHAVLVGGTPLREVFRAWRRQHPTRVAAGEQDESRALAGLTVEAAALREAGRRKTRHTWDFPSMPTSAQRRQDASSGSTAAPSSKVGHDLKERDLDDRRVLEESRLREQFFETRVGSVERLIGWYVLFHAMAEPVSRLPFLRFDLGKTESRLRVASTPAPVAMLAGQAAHVVPSTDTTTSLGQLEASSASRFGDLSAEDRASVCDFTV